MARGRQTLTQRIALDGGREIREELEALGADGRRVFQRLSQAAEETAEAGSRLNRFVADLRKSCEELREAGREVGRARVILMSLLLREPAWRTVRAEPAEVN